jgi:hypothetical protein
MNVFYLILNLKFFKKFFFIGIFDCFFIDLRIEALRIILKQIKRLNTNITKKIACLLVLIYKLNLGLIFGLRKIFD